MIIYILLITFFTDFSQGKKLIRTDPISIRYSRPVLEVLEEQSSIINENDSRMSEQRRIILQENLIKLFKKFDADNDGYLQFGEMKQWFKLAERIHTKMKILPEMKHYDTNRDKFVTKKEMTVGLASLANNISKQEYDPHRFNLADNNRDEKLDEEEFVSFHAPHTSSDMTYHQVKTMLRNADTDKDNQISFEEHKRFEGGEKKEKNVETFDLLWDRNSDGYLDEKELFSVHDMAQHHDENVYKHIDMVDLNKDLKVSKDEVAASWEYLLEEKFIHDDNYDLP